MGQHSSSNRLAVALSAAALITAVSASGLPALAAVVFAENSDKFDGKHAVGAGATPAQRKGKLVATNSAGRLPNNIIAKAPDADRLDGLSSGAFSTRARVDALPGTRIVGLGQVTSAGILSPNSYFPGGSVADAGTGQYGLTLPGYSPGCEDPFPFVIAAPASGFGEATAGTGVMSCLSGDVTVYVNTASSSGTTSDRGFGFVLVTGKSGGFSAPRRGPDQAAPTECRLGPRGVRCS